MRSILLIALLVASSSKAIAASCDLAPPASSPPASYCTGPWVSVDPSSSVLTTWMINNSTATRTRGEIVVMSMNAGGFTFTTAAATTTVLGVVYDASIAVGSYGKIARRGAVLVRNGAAASSRGQHIQSSTIAGQAQSSAAPAAYTSVGIWWDPCAAAQLCWAWLK